LTCTSVYKKQTRKRVFSNVLTIDVYEARHSGDFKSEHSKKCWVVLTQFWVKYGQTRNVGLKM